MKIQNTKALVIQFLELIEAWQLCLLDFNRNKGSNAGNVSHHDIVYRALILIKHLLQQAMAPRQEVNTFFQQMGYVLARMGANS